MMVIVGVIVLGIWIRNGKRCSMIVFVRIVVLEKGIVEVVIILVLVVFIVVIVTVVFLVVVVIVIVNVGLVVMSIVIVVVIVIHVIINELVNISIGCSGIVDIINRNVSVGGDGRGRLEDTACSSYLGKNFLAILLVLRQRSAVTKAIAADAFESIHDVCSNEW
jgi:hypothetical protein